MLQYQLLPLTVYSETRCNFLATFVPPIMMKSAWCFGTKKTKKNRFTGKIFLDILKITNHFSKLLNLNLYIATFLKFTYFDLYYKISMCAGAKCMEKNFSNVGIIRIIYKAYLSEEIKKKRVQVLKPENSARYFPQGSSFGAPVAVSLPRPVKFYI